ncbi:hypothetical protein GE061_011451 [Apolygus lucorum]|uniref:N-acetyltransferase domain-containing protein n=1 Tax=Apolygus lucorum TaxID=248454 RepID=A0A8S9XYY0_APOLU|nr:hypothetical protein GE061_011451 [Apolygus lucorum]
MEPLEIVYSKNKTIIEEDLLRRKELTLYIYREVECLNQAPTYNILPSTRSGILFSNHHAEKLSLPSTPRFAAPGGSFARRPRQERFRRPEPPFCGSDAETASNTRDATSVRECRTSCQGKSPPFVLPSEMEVAGEGRNFRLVHEDELPGIQEFLTTFLPYSLKIHQTIRTYLRDRVWDFNFYVAKSWPEDPIILHFPGQTCTPCGYINESFTVFCPPDRLDLLELLRTEDILADWSRTFYMNFTQTDIVDAIEAWPFVTKVERTNCDIYVLTDPPPEEIQLEEMQGEDCKLEELRPEHAAIIHSLYPARELEDVEVFTRLITKLPAYGVFSKGELAAWMIQSYYGAMFSMQTRPEYRRKGFGIHLAQALTNKVRSRGYIPFVMIRPENDASLGLYHKLGYIRSYPSTRAVFHVEESEKEANSREEKETEDSIEKELKDARADIENGKTNNNETSIVTNGQGTGKVEIE